ncbi:hypothetical protein L9F63_023861, partial [Diploptera punctata]
ICHNHLETEDRSRCCRNADWRQWPCNKRAMAFDQSPARTCRGRLDQSTTLPSCGMFIKNCSIGNYHSHAQLLSRLSIIHYASNFVVSHLPIISLWQHSADRMRSVYNVSRDAELHTRQSAAQRAFRDRNSIT